MTTHKFPIGSKIVRINPVEYDRYQCSFIIKAHSYGRNSEQYEFEPQKNCGTHSSIEWVETNYELEKPLFKFPIGSMISWNNARIQEHYLVTGFDYENDQYNLQVIKTNSDSGLSVGYKFLYPREVTEKDHTLISNEITNTDFKFKIGDKINIFSDTVYKVADISLATDNYIIEKLLPYPCPGILCNRKSIDDKYKIYVATELKCIPPNPLESGWHWIKSKGWTDTQSPIQPRWWSATHQKWSRTHGTRMSHASTPEEAGTAQWVYFKPCNY